MEKEKRKTFEAELPPNYKAVKTIDAKSAQVGIVLNLIAFAVLIVCVVSAYFIMGVPINELLLGGNGFANLARLAVWVVVMLVYVILHELVHGAVYKAMTKQKLTFGLTFTVAFCGVPKIYVYRKTSLMAVLAPFVVFLPVFLTLCFVLSNPLEKILAVAMLGLHIGGCSGDLWVSGVLLFKFRNRATLMNDTGPTQTFYVPSEENDLRNI